jgi:hypothetical protein
MPDEQRARVRRANPVEMDIGGLECWRRHSGVLSISSRKTKRLYLDIDQRLSWRKICAHPIELQSGNVILRYINQDIAAFKLLGDAEGPPAHAPE